MVICRRAAAVAVRSCQKPAVARRIRHIVLPPSCRDHGWCSSSTSSLYHRYYSSVNRSTSVFYPFSTITGGRRRSSYTSSSSSTTTSTSTVRIGHVSHTRGPWPPLAPHLLPRGYLNDDNDDDDDDLKMTSSPSLSAAMLQDLQWMLAKDALRQDMLLVGPPGAGAVYRRRLALAYAQLVRREVHVVTITADQTESDLKQRREIVVNRNSSHNNNNNNNGSRNHVEKSLCFVNQAPVEAALHGRILILDGLEKAERNVLPTLNNLLEHRSMNLEDGRLLVSPERYQQLLLQQQHGEQNGSGLPGDISLLLPVHPDFRVIATAVPVPTWQEDAHCSSLDPPLRSRFQIRRIDYPPASNSSSSAAAESAAATLLEAASSDEDKNNGHLLLASSLIGAMSAASHENKKILQFPVTSLPYLARTLRTFPAQDLQSTLLRQYPVGCTTNTTIAANDVDDSKSGGSSSCSLIWNSARQIASQKAFAAAWREVTGNSAGSNNKKKSTNKTTPFFESSPYYYQVKSIERSQVDSSCNIATADDGYWANATFHLAQTSAAVDRTATTADAVTTSKTSKSGWWWSKPEPGNDASSSIVQQVTVQIPVGSGSLWNTEDAPATISNRNCGGKSPFVSTVGWEEHVWPAMLQEHAMGRDLLLLAPVGEGKTAMAREFCQRLGYNSSSSSPSSSVSPSSSSSSPEVSCETVTSSNRSVRLVSMYRDMTSRDLFLRRATDPETGATGWEETPLLEAIREGHVCLLDGVEKLRPHVLASSLLALTNDRDVWLDDGRRIVAQNRVIDISSQAEDEEVAIIELDESKIIRVHPTFRIIALASISNNNSNQSPGPSTAWLSDSLISCFSTIMLPRPSRDCMRDILRSAASTPAGADANGLGVVDEKTIDQLLELRRVLSSEVAVDCGVAPLSTRNLVRVVRRLSLSSSSSTQLHDLLSSVLVADLLPPTQRAALESVFHRVGIRGGKNKHFGKGQSALSSHQNDSIICESDFLSIGDFTMPRSLAQRPEMVPAPKFFDIKSHVLYIKDLLEDWKSGERAFLLLGGQGVGKNMLVDRLCQVANFEREYIQLHRDSTMGQITLQPTLEDGKIVWNDSPLIRAVSEGLSLVIDEADKAPTEVFVVLKALVEDGELMLGDGRRISRHDEGPGIIKMHPDFTLWVLANRPGFPFHGNAFFKEIGDCFSTRVVANPDLTSEISLLQSYGPNVDPALIRSLAGAFAELRSLSDHGDITYPYSTREAVAVIKHLQGYPDDGVVASLHNVLDWDSFDENTYATLGRVFQRHGIPVEDFSSWQESLLRQQALADAKGKLEIVYSGRGGDEGTSHSPPPLSNPKEGKWDDNNEAHIGGNQWAGGTGGSDTAGLGGRGGPYRLDRGHKVHQVSDEDKKKVSSEATRAARNMAQKALQERLDSIEMSQKEWDMYRRFVDPIQQDIASLRAILKQVMEMRKSSSERGWMKRQSHGELDDTKLVDSVTGDKYVYKRRGAITPNDPTTKRRRPKRLRFVVDVSGSMYRFNGYDERLIRCLEATNLVMESFAGLDGQHEFDYSIVGHSGDSPCIPLVDFGKPPVTEKDRMKVLQTMVAHSQFCQSGDHTLEAMEQAMMDVVTATSGLDDDDDEYDMDGSSDKEDERIVIAISDANLQRYGIHPRELGKIMQHQQGTTTSSVVKAYCIFIASFGKEAQDIQQALPVGRGHVCMQTSDLPRIVRQILTMHI